MDIVERLLGGLVGILTQKGGGEAASIAAVFLDHFWEEYKNVVSKSGQKANGYRRGEAHREQARGHHP